MSKLNIVQLPGWILNSRERKGFGCVEELEKAAMLHRREYQRISFSPDYRFVSRQLHVAGNSDRLVSAVFEQAHKSPGCYGFWHML